MIDNNERTAAARAARSANATRRRLHRLAAELAEAGWLTLSPEHQRNVREDSAWGSLDVLAEIESVRPSADR